MSQNLSSAAVVIGALKYKYNEPSQVFASNLEKEIIIKHISITKRIFSYKAFFFLKFSSKQ